ANFIYGQKELYYLESIETKNYVAIFNLEPRADSRPVIDNKGAVNQDPDSAMLLLRSITLYSSPDYYHPGVGGPIPIKEVHFEYDYSLCKGVTNFHWDASHLDPTHQDT